MNETAAMSAAPSLSPQQMLDRLRGRLMGESLTALLDRQDGLREALPQLMMLESALLQRGTDVIDTMTRPVLIKVCSQLNGLQLPADDLALQDLLERLMKSLEAPARTAPNPVQLQYLSDFVTDDKLHVTDASYTDFAEAAGELAPTQPARL